LCLFHGDTRAVVTQALQGALDKGRQLAGELFIECITLFLPINLIRPECILAKQLFTLRRFDQYLLTA